MDNETFVTVLGLADNRTIAACFTANILPVMTAEGEILDLGSSNSIVLLLFVLFEPKLWSVTLFVELASPTLASVTSPEAE